MKFNWGHGIVLSFVLFCTFVIYIVVQAFQLDVDLVSDTYYVDELGYQKTIDEKSNLAQSGVEVTFDQTNDQFLLKFPVQFKAAAGDIYFYHPSREIFDKHYTIALNDQNEQVISKADLIKGRFKVKINWTVNDTPYYQEKEVFLQ